MLPDEYMVLLIYLLYLLRKYDNDILHKELMSLFLNYKPLNLVHRVFFTYFTIITHCRFFFGNIKSHFILKIEVWVT